MKDKLDIKNERRMKVNRREDFKIKDWKWIIKVHAIYLVNLALSFKMNVPFASISSAKDFEVFLSFYYPYPSCHPPFHWLSHGPVGIMVGWGNLRAHAQQLFPRGPGPNKLQEPQTNARASEMFSEFVRVGPPLKTSFLPSSLHYGNKVPSTHKQMLCFIKHRGFHHRRRGWWMICDKNIDILGHHPIDVFNLVSPLPLDIQICHTRIIPKMTIRLQVLYRGHKTDWA